MLRKKMKKKKTKTVKWKIFIVYVSRVQRLQRDWPGGNVVRRALWAAGWWGYLLATELPELCDDHFAAVNIAMQQGQQLGEPWGTRTEMQTSLLTAKIPKSI